MSRMNLIFEKDYGIIIPQMSGGKGMPGEGCDKKRLYKHCFNHTG